MTCYLDDFILYDGGNETGDGLAERLGIQKRGDDPAGDIARVPLGAEQRQKTVPPGNAFGGNAGLLQKPVGHGGIVGPGADGARRGKSG